MYAPSGSGSHQHISLEKDTMFTDVLIVPPISNMEGYWYGALRPMVKDDSLTNELTKGRDFEVNKKSVYNAVRIYNVQNFKKPAKEAYQRLASVQFYARILSKKDQSLLLRVNDSLEYQIPKKYPLMLELPVEAPSKVCVVSETGSYCELFLGSVCMIKTYEVLFNAYQNLFSIERKTRKEQQEYLKTVNEK
jgi:hypothetical protein